MSKRAIVIGSLILALFIWGFGWPFLSMQLNLRQGKHVQESLLESLKSRYPNRMFKPAGVGYNGPSVGIRVAGQLDPETKAEMRRFLEDEKRDQGIRAWLLLEFDGQDDQPERF